MNYKKIALFLFIQLSFCVLLVLVVWLNRAFLVDCLYNYVQKQKACERTKEYIKKEYSDSLLEWLEAFRKAVRKNKAIELAAMIQFPIVTIVNDRYVIVDSAEQFVANYSKIMHAGFKRALANFSYDQIHFNDWLGISLANGRVLIDGGSNRFYIVQFQSLPEDSGLTQCGALEYLEPKGREVIHPFSDEDGQFILDFLYKDGWRPSEYNWRYVIYQADINNDGSADYVITAYAEAYGLFRIIDSVWSNVAGDKFVKLPIEKVYAQSFNIKEEKFEWCKVHVTLSYPFPVSYTHLTLPTIYSV